MAARPFRRERLVTTGFVIAALAWLVEVGLAVGGIGSWSQVLSMTVIVGVLGVIYLHVWRQSTRL